MVYVERMQYPVGQGGLHFGLINCSLNSGQLFAYIYDCGSSPKKNLTSHLDEIQVILDENRAHIKFLYIFISHLHYDHYSGLKELLSRIQNYNFRIKLVLPYITDIEKIILLLDSEKSRDSDNFDDYSQFLNNPKKYLSPYDNLEIQYLTNKPTPKEYPYDDYREEYMEVPRTWPDDKDNKNLFISHNSDFKFKTSFAGNRKVFWILKPFLRTIEKSLINKLEKEICKKFHWHQCTLSKILSQIEDDILSKNDTLKHLKTCYGTVFGCGNDLNLTSLCLYSGVEDNRLAYFNNIVRPYAPYYASSIIKAEEGACYCNPSWMHTGDSNFTDNDTLDKFKKHYRQYFKYIGVCQIPHHGSKNNFNNEFLNLFNRSYNNPTIFYVTCKNNPGGKGSPKLSPKLPVPTLKITEEQEKKLAVHHHP